MELTKENVNKYKSNHTGYADNLHSYGFLWHEGNWSLKRGFEEKRTYWVLNSFFTEVSDKSSNHSKK